jgi:hypothetical protein
MMPRQILASDSTLGKALLAKYGTPVDVSEPDKEDKVGGGRMVWWNAALGNNGPEVIADCSTMHEKQCELEVEDDQIVDHERVKQAQIDDQRKRASQPASAPQL